MDFILFICCPCPRSKFNLYFLQIDLERDELIRRMSDFNIRIPKRREARQPHLSEENQLILKVQKTYSV